MIRGSRRFARRCRSAMLIADIMDMAAALFPPTAPVAAGIPA